jgi:hypothetical protein
MRPCNRAKIPSDNGESDIGGTVVYLSLTTYSRTSYLTAHIGRGISMGKVGLLDRRNGVEDRRSSSLDFKIVYTMICGPWIVPILFSLFDKYYPTNHHLTLWFSMPCLVRFMAYGQWNSAMTYCHCRPLSFLSCCISCCPSKRAKPQQTPILDAIREQTKL